MNNDAALSLSVHPHRQTDVVLREESGWAPDSVKISLYETLAFVSASSFSHFLQFKPSTNYKKRSKNLSKIFQHVRAPNALHEYSCQLSKMFRDSLSYSNVTPVVYVFCLANITHSEQVNKSPTPAVSTHY